MKTITVFTPTYNRAHLLPRLYESLCRQSSQDFMWMVIDDGSADGTGDLVEKWKIESQIEIRYFYKENGGMHTAHNLAYNKITTELNVCIDSDDWMPDDAVEKILKLWHAKPDKSKIAGVIGLDADNSGKIIGTKIPSFLDDGNLHDLYHKYGVSGDKKIILRTDVVRQFAMYPEFPNEKLVPLGILYLMIGKDYNCIYSNEILCIVEYQAQGSSDSIVKQYGQSPNGFAYSRKVQIHYLKDFRNQIKNYAHLISSSMFAKNPSLAFVGVNPVKTIMVYPVGFFLHLYFLFRIYSS